MSPAPTPPEPVAYDPPDYFPLLRQAPPHPTSCDDDRHVWEADWPRCACGFWRHRVYPDGAFAIEWSR